MWFLCLIAIGAVQASSKCSDQDVSLCLSDIGQNFAGAMQGMKMSQSDFEHACEVLEKQVHCPAECESNTEIGPMIKSVMDFKNFICSKDSDTTKLYSETIPCLEKHEKGIENCTRYIKAPTNQEEACKNFCEISMCTLKIAEKCGKEGRKFIEINLGPLSATMKMQCKEPCSGGQILQSFSWISATILALITLIRVFNF